MPALSAVFAWAVPVKLETLEMHLEVCIKLQPTFTTFRLCHRFGGSENVLLARLPAELVKAIEEILTECQRNKTRVRWQVECRCYRHGCSRRDDIPRGWEVKVPRVQARLSKCGQSHHPLDRGDLEHCIHTRRSRLWEKRMGRLDQSDRGPLDERQAFFRQHLGLEIWTSPLQLSKALEDTPSSNPGFGHKVEFSVTYLKLPHLQSFHAEWPNSRYGREDGIKVSGYGVPVVPCNTLTKKDGRKFQRALKMLGLHAYHHPAEVDALASVEQALARQSTPLCIPRWT